MQIKGIIFDLDGTLLDSIEDLGDSANKLFMKYGYPKHRKEDFIKWIGNGASKFIQDGIGSVVDKETLVNYVSEFKAIYTKNLNIKTHLYYGIATLLNEVVNSGIQISILSNKPHLLTQKIVAHYFDQWPFECIVGQKDNIPRKPDPTAAIQIAKEMELQPENILFIGDSQGDVKTAIAAGMSPVFVNWGYGSLEGPIKNQAIIVNSPKEIIDLLV